MPSSKGTSIFQEAFLRRDHEVAEHIEALVKKEGTELACDWMSPDGTTSNLLKQSLSTRATNEIKKAVNLMGSTAIPFIRAAKAMKDCFKDLLLGHSGIVEDAFTGNSLIRKACDFRVHVDYTNSKLRQNTALHIGTTDSIAEWTHNDDPASLEESWRAKHVDAVEKMEKGGNTSTAEASLMYVCIENAAKVGMDGILRPLLFQNMPEHVFNTDIVKWIILFKWHKIWKPRFIKKALFYAVFLALFTIYAVFIGASAEMSDQRQWRTFFSTAILIVLFGFGILMLKEEIAQMTTFMKDGLTHFKKRTWGVEYYLSSKWNWVDLISCFLLLVLIPLFHALALIHSKFDNWLSAIIALEAVVASMKVIAVRS